MNKIKSYFNQVAIEMKKVSWLSKEELMGSTMVVGLFAIILALFLFVIDYAISDLVFRLFNLNG
ncbi:MAG: preprotein translocase subunit SecE [Candidatus Marinimicrobia bacterium]|mgnify:FL=1|nr:preprotein translocase subunit SecE [Candidatus Neomarinimicrobiota bacterium]|tara:strand:+ start:317 stop:508 length:192 start_codon:yes stop_codon:yes gene_type:complete